MSTFIHQNIIRQALHWMNPMNTIAMIRNNDTFRQALLYGLSLVMMKGISILMLPVYTHYLSSMEYGRLEILVSFSSLISIIVSFGLVEALYRFVGLAEKENNKKRFAAQFSGLSIIIALFSLVILFIASPWIATILPGEIRTIDVQLLSIALACGGLINIPLSWLRMREKAGLFFILTTGKVIIQATLSIIWLKAGWGITSVLASGAIAAILLSIILLGYQIIDTGIRFTNPNIFELLKYAVPIIVSGIAAFGLSGLDRFLLAQNVGESQLALYAVASKFAIIPFLLIQPFTLWWYPRRFGLLKQKDGIELNAKYSIWGSLLGIYFCSLIGFIGPYVIIISTPQEYHFAAKILPWLLIASGFKIVSELLNLGCYINKNTNLQMYLNLIITAVGVSLFFVMIPAMGLYGATISLIICYSIKAFLFYYFSQNIKPLPYKIVPLVHSIGICLLMLYLGQVLIGD